jgi:hypothetical protein
MLFNVVVPFTLVCPAPPLLHFLNLCLESPRIFGKSHFLKWVSPYSMQCSVKTMVGYLKLSSYFYTLFSSHPQWDENKMLIIIIVNMVKVAGFKSTSIQYVLIP